ncbi:MAG: carbohydrate kinase, partial [Candidatus Eremiobacteraeota bacterium]|nr:carbohydrate kinase [Candidatus Eremiobacteraeota bacterium]
LTQAIAWADTRAAEQARQLRAVDPEAHRRTGTPIHPMAWPAKILWLQEHQPELWKRCHRLLDHKTYILERLTGHRLPMDRSNASATGLYATDRWDPQLVARLGLQDRLPEVAEPDYSFECLGRPAVLGGGDGPLANLGVGAVAEGRLAVSLGTSGAVRGVTVHPTHKPELFLYALDAESWVQGGAISNGTSVFDWLNRLRPTPLAAEELVELAAQAPAGAAGLKVHPYFSGERAPYWDPAVESRIVGWSYQHGFAELSRACLEGVAFCLRRLVGLWPPSTLRCTGGLFADAFFTQLLADVCDCPVAVAPYPEATALGAALMHCPDRRERALALPAGEPVEPQTEIYKELYAQWVAC